MSATHEYITHGATMSKPETLLRAICTSPAGALNETFNLMRGKKVIAQLVRRDKQVELQANEHTSHLNSKRLASLLEDAKDALYVFDADRAQVKRDKLKLVPDALLQPKSARIVQVPQVLVTLTPEGGLFIELPAGPGARRKVELREGEEGATLKRILSEQRAGNISIGQDGAPTSAQVHHWEHHLDGQPSPRCSFCLSEGLIRGTPKRQLRKQIISKSKDVEVRRILAVQKKKRGEASVTITKQVNVEDLDL